MAAFIHAAIDELVISLLGGLGQGRTAVLHKALYVTRKASSLRQCYVRADADWKASDDLRVDVHVGEQRGTLVCWCDGFLAEADEGDLDVP